jgi:L-alanine-DL-glutamate epimerase-like enolase superfamily enzyme
MKVFAQKQFVDLKEPFRVAFGIITGLDIVEVRIERDGLVGRGECCPMSIYRQTPDAALAEIAAIAPAIQRGEVDRIALQDALPARSARNALDCAFWDLEAKASGRSVWDLAGIGRVATIVSDVTIGILSPEESFRAAAKLDQPAMIKLKLGGERDLDCLRAVRAARPDTPLFVDVNAGWTLDQLNERAPMLAEAGVFMIEQPLPPNDDALLDGYNRLVPLCADESCHDRSDLPRLHGRFDYINNKLDNTGGLTEALALVEAGRDQGFRLMVGCMLATGLAMAPAYLIASLCDVVDLDAPLIVKHAAHAGIRHDGRLLHDFDAELWG